MGFTLIILINSNIVNEKKNEKKSFCNTIIIKCNIIFLIPFVI